MTIRVEKRDTAEPLWHALPREREGVVRVENCVPVHLDGIVKIFHALRGAERTWDVWDPALQRYLPGEGRREINVAALLPPASNVPGQRVRWKEVVVTLGLKWHPEVNGQTLMNACGGVWPVNLDGGVEGRLDQEQLRALVRCISDARATPTAVASHPVFRCDPMEDWRFYFDLADIEAVRAHPILQYDHGPAEVMATDQTWFLLQDIDLQFSLLAAAYDVLDRVLSDPVIEGLRVTGDHRVDYRADTINRHTLAADR